MTSRVIALDLDGTLLTPRKTLLPATLDALSHAREAGYQLIIVTGRHHVAIHPFYQALALNTPVICCNGTYLYDYHGKKVLNADPLSLSQTLQVIDIMNEFALHGLMYVDDAMLWQYPTSYVSRARRWAKSLPPTQRPTLLQVASLTQAAHQVKAVWKFALSDDNNEKLRQFVYHVEQALELECEWSWRDQVDIAQRGNTKGRRLTEWVESWGGSMQDVVAFGDNHNDISMLKAAGTGVAMGNADDVVKACASIVIGDNSSDSIARFIHTHLL